MLYIFYNDIDKNECAKLVLEEINNPYVTLIPAGKNIWSYKNTFSRFLLHMGFCLHFPFKYNFNHNFISIVKQIKKSDTILIFAGGFGISPCLSFPFLKFCNAQKKYLWLWDSVLSKTDLRFLKYLKKYYEVFTFDAFDAEKYGLTYKNTVAHFPFVSMSSHEEKLESDIYFVGKDRGRYDKINKLFEIFSKQGIVCDLSILRDETSPQKEKTLKFSERRISQYENYDRLNKSRSVLDIPVAGQHGLTQRTLESLFLRRKVITTNEWIKKEKLYSEENVYIITDENLNDIQKFLSASFRKTDLSDYKIDNWIRAFIVERGGVKYSTLHIISNDVRRIA